ncbi:hypothetical protein BKA67DRAFT_534669 [Truncatella angustata]|uniref:Uncharacterized protein n=1 Tax=Truncatella angustata TaxID=152316 RepID=A0A9P8UPA2_9PEZI|nr:uncharacterized protein BKA67DRAFT_534669 [Truncatella angustata]KAH6655753.1 hypothetical protein BKA67DRAFT_534669 [Truncatella angustata]
MYIGVGYSESLTVVWSISCVVVIQLPRGSNLCDCPNWNNTSLGKQKAQGLVEKIHTITCDLVDILGGSQYNGAKIKTLTGGFTESTLTTTSTSGDDSPTIAPVIVPSGNTLWFLGGCISSFTNPSIRINLPYFCVGVFGFKIGNCTSDKNKDNGK